MPDLELLSNYDYSLPPELIASQPCSRRDGSRLMVIDRASGEIQHRHFYDFPELLSPNDCLILNMTKVVPARLQGVRDQTGGKWEGLFLKEKSVGEWELIGQTRGKLQVGETLTLSSSEGNPSSGVQVQLKTRLGGGRWLVSVDTQSLPTGGTFELLDQIGSIPLPPYIRHGQAQQEDKERYQTVYAETPGSAAAPTAGLHFTSEILEKCRDLGVRISEVTLHVGLGTFRPVQAEKLSDHRMHAEWCEVSADTVEVVRQTRERGGRVVAVGTTSVRTLETASLNGALEQWAGESELFIRPGFEFHSTDAMLTNFHLPKSTLLVMLSAFASHSLIMRAYEQAVNEQYRFFSYGDAMFVK